MELAYMVRAISLEYFSFPILTDNLEHVFYFCARGVFLVYETTSLTSEYNYIVSST